MTDYKHEVRDYNNGQIHGWNGGNCPVHPETLVKTWHRNGMIQDHNAGGYRWKHSDTDGDIIAFQVVKAYVEPKVIWVNEYPGGGGRAYGYSNEQAAKTCVGSHAIRIAVKYIEVVDDKEVKE